MRQARRFPCQPESVAGARHFVRDALSAQPREIVEAAELMTSEVATNSVRHAQSDFELAILLSRREIRVEVSDQGQGQPVPRSPRTEERSGRGLQIVLALSDAWGVTPSANGKLVWFALQLHTPAREHESQSTASRGKAEQCHELEQRHDADPGTSNSPIAEVWRSQWTFKAYAETWGQPEMAISVRPPNGDVAFQGIQPGFEVQASVRGGRHTLLLSGELDFAVAAGPEATIRGLSGEGVSGIEPDLSQLTFMDSSGSLAVPTAKGLCGAWIRLPSLLRLRVGLNCVCRSSGMGIRNSAQGYVEADRGPVNRGQAALCPRDSRREG